MRYLIMTILVLIFCAVILSGCSDGQYERPGRNINKLPEPPSQGR